MALELARIKVPAGFHPDQRAHVEQVLAKVAETEGGGWSVQSFDQTTRTLTVQRTSAHTELQVTSDDTFEVGLGNDVRATEGEKVAQQLEQDNQGFFLTEFRPHVKRARLSRLSEAEVRCRDAVAGVLGVPRWEVQVASRKDGGFSLRFPPRYSPSRHDKGLQEVAESVVGREGWYFSANANALTGDIIPAEPPTFDPVIPYPFGAATRDLWSIPIGHQLGGLGEKSKPLELPIGDVAGTMVSGTAGGGKTVSINAIVFGLLSRGWEVAIGDVPHKAVDFEWMKPFVREQGWGCDSQAHTVAMLGEVYAERERRAAILREHGVQKIQDLPAHARPRPIAVIVDELTGLFTMEPAPKIRDKSHPLVVEAAQQNLEVELTKRFIRRIPAELRFVGIRILIASQISQANTGVDSTIKTNMANRLLLGSNATKSQRGHALLNPDAVPEVPRWVQSDRDAARGTGLYEFEGSEPGVFKAYFATTDEYRSQLDRLGVPRASQPVPSAATIARHVPRIDEDEEGYGRGPRKLEDWEIDEDGKPLSGFARANAARAAASAPPVRMVAGEEEMRES